MQTLQKDQNKSFLGQNKSYKKYRFFFFELQLLTALFLIRDFYMS